MLVCSGTMPTFEPQTTKQTNLALCSTIQTGFIDRRIAATRSNLGSSRVGINAVGAAPGARGHPRRDGTAQGCPRPSCWHHCCPSRAFVPTSGALRGRSGSWRLQSSFEWAIPGATALLYFKADAAELSPTVLVLLSSRCSQGSSSSRKIQGPFRGKEGWIWLLPPPSPE